MSRDYVKIEVDRLQEVVDLLKKEGVKEVLISTEPHNMVLEEVGTGRRFYAWSKDAVDQRGSG